MYSLMRMLYAASGEELNPKLIKEILPVLQNAAEELGSQLIY